MIRVGIVEDHPLFLRGLSQVIDVAPGTALGLAVGTVAEFEERVPGPLDVVIVDLGLPDARGGEAVRRIGAAGIPVLVISATEQESIVLDAMASGARGYLTKSADSSDIIAAIETVACGGSYISPAVASLVLRAAGTATKGGEFAVLTPREREVLSLLASGETNEQIAHLLGISVRTVGSHLDRIREKTGRRRRADLTRLAIEEGLVDGVS